MSEALVPRIRITSDGAGRATVEVVQPDGRTVDISHVVSRAAWSMTAFERARVALDVHAEGVELLGDLTDVTVCAS